MGVGSLEDLLWEGTLFCLSRSAAAAASDRLEDSVSTRAGCLSEAANAARALRRAVLSGEKDRPDRSTDRSTLASLMLGSADVRFMPKGSKLACSPKASDSGGSGEDTEVKELPLEYTCSRCTKAF